MIYLISIILVIVIAVYISTNIEKKNQQIAKVNEGKFRDILNDKNLQSDQIIFTAHNKSSNCLSVDENNEKLSFGYAENNVLKTREYNFSDIVGFEVQIDDQKTGKLSVGGAIVGGVLAGGVGAIIGGTSGKGKTKINTMHLLITVNSISNPLIKFSILKPSIDGKGYNNDNFMVRKSAEIAEKWTGIFAVILKKSTV
jgi:hypothetical protein